MQGGNYQGIKKNNERGKIKKKMDTKEFSESTYVNVELVRNSPTKRCIIKTDAKAEDVTFDGQTSKRITLEVELDGKIKGYSPNRTSLKNIQDGYGFESKKWVGKALHLNVVKMPKECVLATVEK